MGKREEKHGPNATVDPRLERAVKKMAQDNELSCALAYTIASELNIAPAMVGRAADLCGVDLIKCRLGLYGYKPEKKVIKPAKVILPELKKVIMDSVSQGRISCARCWEIAEELDISKISVSSACEAMSIKIKPCQLGAF